MHNIPTCKWIIHYLINIHLDHFQYFINEDNYSKHPCTYIFTCLCDYFCRTNFCKRIKGNTLEILFDITQLLQRRLLHFMYNFFHCILIWASSLCTCVCMSILTSRNNSKVGLNFLHLKILYSSSFCFCPFNWLPPFCNLALSYLEVI